VRKSERGSTAAKAGERRGDFGARSEVQVFGEVYKDESENG
jgi:hypothetical protein